MDDNHDRLHAAIASMRTIDMLLQQIAEAVPQTATAADAALLETLKGEADAAQCRFSTIARQIMAATKTLN